MKGKLFLIHWNLAEAELYAEKLRSDGWDVRLEAKDGGQAYQSIAEFLPDVIVTFLSRLPSHGLVTTEHVHARKSTSHTPLIFVDGKEEAVEKTRAKLPDAIYTTSDDLNGVLARYARK